MRGALPLVMPLIAAHAQSGSFGSTPAIYRAMVTATHLDVDYRDRRAAS
jgi:hypothetical protein